MWDVNVCSEEFMILCKSSDQAEEGLGSLGQLDLMSKEHNGNECTRRLNFNLQIKACNLQSIWNVVRLQLVVAMLCISPHTGERWGKTTLQVGLCGMPVIISD